MSRLDASWFLVAIPAFVALGVAYLLLRPYSTPESTPGQPDPCQNGGCLSGLVNHFGFSLDAEDPSLFVVPDSLLRVDNFVISWDKDAEWSRNLNQEDALREDLRFASSKNRVPMLTLEPWPKKGRSPRTLLQDIVTGKYDSEISWVCSSIGQYDQFALIRWGHEMENITGRYPWATRDGQRYAGAYNYFVDKCRLLAPKAAYMWSPAGNKNLSDYWPGAPNVDYVGLTVYDYEAWEIRYYGYNRPFKENFEERYLRVAGYHKPVVIAEFGATGEKRVEWINAALKELQEYPSVKGIILFSGLDPVTWGSMPAPDWRVQPPAGREP